jgi:hypothetical protein
MSDAPSNKRKRAEVTQKPFIIGNAMLSTQLFICAYCREDSRRNYPIEVEEDGSTFIKFHLCAGCTELNANIKHIYREANSKFKQMPHH